MNTIQKRVLIVSTVLLLLSGIFVPCSDFTTAEDENDGKPTMSQYFSGYDVISSIGHSYLVDTLKYFFVSSYTKEKYLEKKYTSHALKINFHVLFIEWTVLFGVTTMLVLAFKRST
jgi:hypothetical protein